MINSSSKISKKKLASIKKSRLVIREVMAKAKKRAVTTDRIVLDMG